MEHFQQKLMLAFLAYLAERGVAPQRICDLSGLDYAALVRGTPGIFQPKRLDNLWKNAARLTRDDLIGLHFGESMQLAALGVVGQVVLTSATVGEALTHAGALLHTIADMFQIRIHHAEKCFTIQLSIDVEQARDYPNTARQMADFLLVFIVHELDGLLLTRITPLRVGLPYAPEKTAEYHRIFRTQPHRTAHDSWIELDNTILQQPVISADYELHRFLLQKIRVLHKNEEQNGAYTVKIYNYLLTNAFIYSQSLESVAANFNMSTRSLQRKLQEENTSFVEIADSVRKNLALNYLNATAHPVKDISFMLGYNEQSAFLRAFKRWTGQSPSAYRSSRDSVKG
jgi:AraC-like DNA-binding protein